MPFYAVSCGRNTGLYTDWSFARDQIHCFSRGECRKFYCKDDAMHFLRHRNIFYYNNSWFCRDNNYSTDHFHCFADFQRELKRRHYWAVARGFYPDIYRSWDEARKQVDHFHPAMHKKFFCENDARHFMRLHTNENRWRCNVSCDGRMGTFHCKKDYVKHNRNMMRNKRRNAMF